MLDATEKKSSGCKPDAKRRECSFNPEPDFFWNRLGVIAPSALDRNIGGSLLAAWVMISLWFSLKRREEKKKET